MQHLRAFDLLNRHWPARLVAGLLVFIPLSLAAQPNWGVYSNLRFGFAVDYPTDIFSSFEEADNSDGATLQSKDSGVEFRAYGFWRTDAKSPRAYFSEEYGSKSLAYSAVKRDFFIASGVANDKIFYGRCNFAGDRVICVKLAYPVAQKEKWDKIVSHVTRSLRAVIVHHGAIK
jgi:hypothetical protein